MCALVFRLDFVTFSIAQPDSTAPTVTGGQCLTDVFTVTGQSNNVPAICGTNSNSHSKHLYYILRTSSIRVAVV